MTFNQFTKIVLCVLLVSYKHAFAKKYHIFSPKMNFFAAFQDCAARNMNLATINSQAEQNDLEKVITAAGKELAHLYIGGTDLAANGTFMWLATGQPFTYTHWQPGEPNNQDNLSERCLIVWPNPERTISWNNVPCHDKFEFICEEREAPTMNVKVDCSKCNSK